MNKLDMVAQIPDALQILSAHPDKLVTDPIGVGACALAAAGSAVGLWALSKPKEIGIAHEPSNPGLVREAVINVVDGKDSKYIVHDRWHRMGAAILSTVGFFGIAAGAVSGAEASVMVAQPNANTVVALETSNSFLNTTDMPRSTSRFEFAKTAMESSSFLGNMAVVQYGDTGSIDTSVALQPFSSNIIKANVVEQPPQFSADGNDVADAITQASGLLPNNKGNIIVITDGIGAENVGKQTVVQATQTAQSKGSNIKFEVIGTSGSKYPINKVGSYDGTPEPSTLESSNLKDISVTNSPKDVEASIKAAIGKPSKVKQERFYYPAMIPGAVILAAGLIKGISQRAKRLI